MADKKNKNPKLSHKAARQRMLTNFMKRHVDFASSFDLVKETFQLISAAEDYEGPKRGTLAVLNEISLPMVLPECREKFTRSVQADNIKRHLAESDKYIFQTFYQNPDGTISRKTHAYYAVDDEKRYILAICEDSTEEYESQQAIAKAREEAAINSSTSSDFIEHLINNQGERRTLLVVEDNELNREILKEFLSAEYDLLCAEDGEKAMDILNERTDEIDLVLLDINLPKVSGFEILEHMRKQDALASIPVIVSTGSDRHEDEIRCLRLGAVDFVTKPYDPASLNTHIKTALRMSTSASTISSLEFDPLSGLYTYRAFRYHAQKVLDAGGTFAVALADIRDLGLLNSTHGTRTCDETIKFLAQQMVEFLPDTLIARLGGRFLALVPQSDFPQRERLLEFIERIRVTAPVPNVRMYVGLNFDVDANDTIDAMYDRVKMATESIDGESTEPIAIYDSTLQEKKEHEIKVLAMFDSAIEKRKFTIWIQPKVNTSNGMVTGGEALVRWNTYDGKVLAPGAFIPLLEREGLIKDLDEHTFRLVCEYQRARLDGKQRVVPVSVNVSRASLYGGDVVERYRAIAEDIGIPFALVPLEITESTATSNFVLREICSDLGRAGFKLHMDDFGSGYSSLSSLMDLPFDVMKIDKSLIDRIESEKGNVLVRYAVEMAQDLGMKIVAEGVESQDQANALAEMDCRTIQGYLYSPPLHVDSFSALLDQDTPFADKTARRISSNDFPQLSPVDFRRYLRLARGSHETVRVLDFDQGCTYVADDEGSLEMCKGNCYDAWGCKTQCDNCTSRRVLKTRGSEHKFEVLGDEAFIVYSKYIELDGEPRVVEMIDSVGSGIMHGVGEASSLLDVVHTAGGEIYRDVQLGTLNRRYFEEKRDELMSAGAVAFVDVDKLKETNDLHGHSAGDELLKTVADALRRSVRSDDRIIRMGGDEFLMVFSQMREGALKPKLDAVRAAVKDAGASVSIGGCYCEGATDEAVALADHAMYKSKMTGQVILEE